MEDSTCSWNLNFNLNQLLLPSINILKHPPINLICKFLTIVAEVIVIVIENGLQIFDTKPVLTHAQTLVQSSIIITPLTNVHH